MWSARAAAELYCKSVRLSSQVPPQECTRSCGNLLVLGVDPQSADGQRLEKAFRALHRVNVLLWALQPALAAALHRVFRERSPDDDKSLYPTVVVRVTGMTLRLRSNYIRLG